VKFLIDNNLSPLLADALKAAGHDAVHLRDLGMQAATDYIVLEHAKADERSWSPLTLISAAWSPGPVPARRQ
jgi:predicted nuclease of predicted toxin-antitoxin system